MNSDTLNFSRRRFLRGMGATIALPFLESVSPGAKALAQGTGSLSPDGQPVRFAAFFMPNGVHHAHWTPEGSRLRKLPRSLQPLEELKEYLSVISGMNNTADTHHNGTSAFLTGQTPQVEKGKATVHNASIDQIIGEALKEQSVFSSLELGVGSSPRGGIYTRHISWKTPTTPVPCEINPQRAFDRLFKSVQAPNGSKPLVFPGQSVLDTVREDARALEKRLGREDQEKLDEYFTAIREVEERIAQQEAVKNLKVTPEMIREIHKTRDDLAEQIKGGRDGRYQANPDIPHREHGRLMMDIIALAFWSNSTRAATLMFGDGLRGGGNMSFLDGVSGDHHSISHHGNQEDKLEQFTRINTYFVEQYAYLLDKLRSFKEGSGNVLENSVVLFGSNITNGQNHRGNNIPVMVAGKAGGRLRPGKHLQAEGKSVAHLHRSILDVMNVEADIGKGKGTLRGI